MCNQPETSNFAITRTPISQEALDQLLYEARTHSTWLPEPVPVELLRKAYELARLGPTSANGSPARFVFLTTPGAKALLRPVLAPGNVDKTMAAPVTVIIAWDTEFHEHLPRLFPQFDMRSYFVGNHTLINETAFRNSSLQAAYFILAARALGLDCGPMSGFDADKLNAAFFPDGKWKVNLLCNLGYGDPSKLHPRNPRLNFEEASVILERSKLASKQSISRASMLPSDAEELFMTKAQYEVFEARRRRPEQRRPMVRPERPCRQQERNVLNSEAPARLAPTGQTQGELA